MPRAFSRVFRGIRDRFIFEMTRRMRYGRVTKLAPSIIERSGAINR